jgi:hypothetical protein
VGTGRGVAPLQGEGLQLCRSRVLQLDRLALVVHPDQVAQPARQCQSEPPARSSGSEGVVQGRKEELGHLGRSIQADSGYLIADFRIGEALDQSVLVGVQVDARDRRQERGDLLAHLALNEGT